MTQCELFPFHQLPVIEHNTNILKEYYTSHQYKYYKNIIQTHFTPAQTRDTRFIPPPLIIPLTQISITECNPEKHINTNTITIQTYTELTHVYENIGTHLTTIPTIKLKWLWQQYNKHIYSTHGLVPPHNPLKPK